VKFSKASLSSDSIEEGEGKSESRIIIGIGEGESWRVTGWGGEIGFPNRRLW